MGFPICLNTWPSRAPKADSSTHRGRDRECGRRGECRYQRRDNRLYARVLKDDVELAVDILNDILVNSVFDERELEREQHVILQEIGAANDTPDDLVFDLFP
ncbi:MAG: insulinase family protein [Nitratireductor sp.]